MHHGARRPASADRVGNGGDDLRRIFRIRTEAAADFRPRTDLRGIVPGDDPRARDGIFAQLHAIREHRDGTGVNCDFLRGAMRNDTHAGCSALL
jgi:hypothetical protein